MNIGDKIICIQISSSRNDYTHYPIKGEQYSIIDKASILGWLIVKGPVLTGKFTYPDREMSFLARDFLKIDAFTDFDRLIYDI